MPTDTEFQTRVVAIARQQGLGTLDMAAATESIRKSGADAATSDAIIADRLHAHASRTGHQAASHGLSADFAQFLGGNLPDWVAGRILGSRKAAFIAAFEARQTQPAGKAFEAQMVAKYGAANWRTSMSPSEKLTLAHESGNVIAPKTSQGDRLRLELAQLKNSSPNTSVFIASERRYRIAQIEKQLGIVA